MVRYRRDFFRAERIFRLACESAHPRRAPERIVAKENYSPPPLTKSGGDEILVLCRDSPLGSLTHPPSGSSVTTEMLLPQQRERTRHIYGGVGSDDNSDRENKGKSPKHITS